MNRRDFLKRSAFTGAVLGSGILTPSTLEENVEEVRRFWPGFTAPTPAKGTLVIYEGDQVLFDFEDSGILNTAKHLLGLDVQPRQGAIEFGGAIPDPLWEHPKYMALTHTLDGIPVEDLDLIGDQAWVRGVNDPDLSWDPPRNGVNQPVLMDGDRYELPSLDLSHAGYAIGPNGEKVVTSAKLIGVSIVRRGTGEVVRVSNPYDSLDTLEFRWTE